MGLDMYLIGDKYNMSSNRQDVDGFPVKSILLELGYWRKHPDLHGYIVQSFADGIDDCQKIELSSNDIQQIIDAVKSGELPKTSGFFFGESESPDEQDTLVKLEKAKAWLDDDTNNDYWKSIYYKASW